MRAAEWICAMLLAAGLAGCKSVLPEDYERHHMSMIRAADTDPGVYVYEARAGGDYPLDSESAERKRLEWLEQWLHVRGWCPAGYELIDRSPIDSSDINLYHMDVRYRVRCAEPGGR